MSAVAGNIAIFVPHSGCPNLCSFCNQRTISGSNNPPTASEAADICRSALEHLSDSVGNVEIAFFGGSFTAIERGYMLELLGAVQPFLANPRVSGIRISTRPDAIDSRILDILRSHGVTAIELGAQSMDNRVLECNRRGHTADDVVRASRLIKSYGFSLGLQMMTGLYCADNETDYNTAVAIAALAPDTVRIYPTVVLGGTELAKLMQGGKYTPPSVEQTIPLCARIADLFEERGIRIIRLGLHSSESMESAIVGGCYHPALGELVAGERYYNQLLFDLERLGGSNFAIRIQPRLLSQLVGNKKRNIARLSQKGYNIRYRADDTLIDVPFEVEKRGE